MIRVNLLPYDMRPIKRTPVPYILVIALFLVAIIYGMLIFFSLFGEIAKRQANINSQKSELERLAATVEEYEELTKQKEKLSNKIATIQEIIADRVIWSKQLEQLAKLTPENIWYNNIKLVWKMDKIWVEKRDKKTNELILNKEGQPVKVQESVRRAFLEIAGFVAADTESGERDINPLTQALQQDEEFSARYDLRNTILEDVELPGYGKVRKFTLEYVISNQ